MFMFMFLCFPLLSYGLPTAQECWSSSAIQHKANLNCNLKLWLPTALREELFYIAFENIISNETFLFNLRASRNVHGFKQYNMFVQSRLHILAQIQLLSSAELPTAHCPRLLGLQVIQQHSNFML